MRFRTRHKYGATRVEVDGHKFHSKREARRYQELKLMEKAGRINELQLQPRFRIEHNGVKICDVILDFKYAAPGEAVPEWRYEDVKGFDNMFSRLKRKLLKAFHGIDVEVIR